MNKRAYLWAGGAILGLLILTKTPLVFSLFALLILGVIPGTALVIPAWVLLVLYPILIAATLFWLSAQPIMIAEPVRAQTKPRKRATRTKKTTTKPVARKAAAKRRARATAV